MSPASPATRRDPFFCTHCQKLSETVFVTKTALGFACWPCLRHYLANLEEEHALLVKSLRAAVALKPAGIATIARRDAWKEIREALAVVEDRR